MWEVSIHFQNKDRDARSRNNDPVSTSWLMCHSAWFSKTDDSHFDLPGSLVPMLALHGGSTYFTKQTWLKTNECEKPVCLSNSSLEKLWINLRISRISIDLFIWWHQVCLVRVEKKYSLRCNYCCRFWQRKQKTKEKKKDK